MRGLVVAGVATLAIATGGACMNSRMQAAPFGDVNAVRDSLATVEKTQFIIGGHRHCWYPDGWHGPVSYWCGYRDRRGFGWGGPEGWQGWWHEERERRERRY